MPKGGNNLKYPFLHDNGEPNIEYIDLVSAYMTFPLVTAMMEESYDNLDMVKRVHAVVQKLVNTDTHMLWQLLYVFHALSDLDIPPVVVEVCGHTEARDIFMQAFIEDFDEWLAEEEELQAEWEGAQN